MAHKFGECDSLMKAEKYVDVVLHPVNNQSFAFERFYFGGNYCVEMASIIIVYHRFAEVGGEYEMV